MPIKKRHKSFPLKNYFLLGGVILLAMALILLKKPSQAQITASSGLQPQAQLEQALAVKKPTLAFYHSNNCQQCIIMIETVDRVFPEFSGSIELVDVNVYDPNNEALLNQVGLQYIPTLIFYDRNGQDQTYVGVMEASELRQRLTALAGAQ